MRQFIRQSLAVAAIVLALFAVAEFVLRSLDIFPKRIVQAEYYTNLLGDFEPNLDTVNDYPQKFPYRFITNSQGLRSLRELSDGKGVVRILCLGDSFTMGWGVDDADTYPEQLERILRERYPDIPVEVVNAGSIFSNVLDQADYYLDKGHRLAPTLVIDQFYLNDICREMCRPWVDRIKNRSTATAYAPPGLPARLLRGSALAKAAALARSRMRPQVMSGQSPEAAQREDSGAGLVAPSPAELEALDFPTVMDETKFESTRRVWEQYAQALLALRDEVSRRGSSFLFLAVPTAEQLFTPKNAAGRYFSRLCQDNAVPFLDLAPVLRNALYQDEGEFFIPGDGHTNAGGNRLLALAVADSLRLTRNPDGTVSLAVVPPCAARVLPPSLKADILAPPGQPLRAVVSPAEAAGPLSAPSGLDVAATCQASGVVSGSTLQGVDYPGLAFLRAADPGQGGTLTVQLESRQGIGAADVLCARKIAAYGDGLARAVLSISREGGPWEELFDYSGTPAVLTDGGEKVKITQLCFEKPVHRLTLRFELRGSALLVRDAADSPGQRLPLRVVLHPAP